MGKLVALTALTIIGLTGVAAAQDVTLRAVTSFAEKTTYSRGFERFIERVNEAGKGSVRINYIGGPKAMPPFEVGNALKNGVVDIANVTGAFYTNLMPEADAWKLRQMPMAELRKNGGFDYMAGIYAQKMNAIFLANLVGDNPFHLYLNKKITAPRSDRSQASHHAGLPRLLPGDGRDRCADRAGRSLHLARAGRGRWLWLADHGHLRSRLA